LPTAGAKARTRRLGTVRCRLDEELAALKNALDNVTVGCTFG
jgi:hypothetical protein